MIKRTIQKPATHLVSIKQNWKYYPIGHTFLVLDIDYIRYRNEFDGRK
jgi:hypothetical protein